MIHTRGSKLDYERWVEQGCTGWGFDDALPYFIKAENNVHGGNELHGDSGPLHVSELLSPREVSKAFVKAAIVNGLDHNTDFNSEKQDGAGLYQVTHFHGEKKASAVLPLPPISILSCLKPSEFDRNHACTGQPRRD